MNKRNALGCIHKQKFFVSYDCAPPQNLSEVKKNEMGSVYFLNTKYKFGQLKENPIVQLIVYL